MAVDSQWANTALLLPLSNDILDAKGHTITASNGAALSSAVGTPFGAGNSLYCDGVNDVVIGTSPDFGIGSGDCSIQFWFYPVTGGHGAAWGRLFTIGPNATNGSLYINTNSSLDPMKFRFEYYNGGFLTLINDVATTISNNAWHFFQLDRVGNVWSAYVDGTLYSTQTTSFTFTQTTLSIGANTAGATAFKGYFSNVRLTVGAYRSDNSVPTAPFLRPTITGTVYDSGGSHTAKVVTATKRSTLALAANTVSDGSSGVYTLYPTDYSEYIVTEFDTATYPLVDGGSGENAIIYDRVIPGG